MIYLLLSLSFVHRGAVFDTDLQVKGAIESEGFRRFSSVGEPRAFLSFLTLWISSLFTGCSLIQTQSFFRQVNN